MDEYSVIQTGAKTKLGGVQSGRGMRSYHAFLAWATKGVPMFPPRMVATIHVAGWLISVMHVNEPSEQQKLDCAHALLVVVVVVVVVADIVISHGFALRAP